MYQSGCDGVTVVVVVVVIVHHGFRGHTVGSLVQHTSQDGCKHRQQAAVKPDVHHKLCRVRNTQNVHACFTSHCM